MGQLLQFCLLGLGPGALIAGIALSVVLTYRGSGTINIAAGSVSVLAAFVFYGLRTGGYLWIPLPFMPHRIDLGGPWDTVPAFAVGVAASLFLGVLLEFVVVRPLRSASPLAKLVATLGILLTVQAMIVLRFGTTGQAAPPVLPNSLVTVFGRPVPKDRLILAGIVVAAAIVLVVVYRRTRFGLSTRAAAENETTARLAGLSPNRLSLVNTLLGSVIAGVLGMLAAPLSQLDATTIPLSVVPALGAALFARFTSFSIAALAGLAMGVIGSLVTYLQTQSWFPTVGGQQLPGVADVIVLIVIVVASFWRGRDLPQRGALRENQLPPAPAAQHRARGSAVCAAFVVVGALTLPYDFRQAMINSLIGAVVCLSFVVLTGFVGQISVVQIALAGVAGFAVQKLAVHAGIAFPFGPIIAVAVATLVGVLVAVSTLRIRGVNLAIVTLATAVAIESFGFDNATWGSGTTGSPVAPPTLFGVDLGPGGSFFGTGYGNPSPGFALLCGLVVIVLGVLVTGLRGSNLGHRMLAVRSNERAAAGAGIHTRAVKLTAFALAAAMAGVAGCLYAYGFGSVSGDRFGIVVALTFVAFAYVGGITTVTGAIIGALGVTQGLVTQALDTWFGIPIEYQLLVGGLLLVVTIAQNPAGIAGLLLDPDGPRRRLRRRPGRTAVAGANTPRGAEALVGTTR